MSTEKLRELSKPVAEIKCHEDLSLSVVNVRYGFTLGRNPVYSQEYVSALLVELKSSQAIANEYQQLMYHMDAGGDFYEFQRDKAVVK
ncbi:hypothetical protein I5U18_15725 [Serratia ureilytica]|uniref:hypothetical protein n=1 Tax=Serratia ureilytica TaxID=300181 RepID=UPI0018D41644|nr:hypothetical protein [Serratia ureilytica]MBH1912023.1 hypothetical protein [Serratia ureilytica]